MRKIFFVLAMIAITHAKAQIQPVREKPVEDTTQNAMPPSDFDISKDAENGAVVYKGIFTLKYLQKEPTFDWMQKGMDAYHPDTTAIAYLRDHIADYDMALFMGTWCSDSQDLIPKLFKVLMALNYSVTDNQVIGVDREKTTKEQYMPYVKRAKVTLVPTIVLLKNGEEIGRITETVNKSVEADLAEIMRKQQASGK